MHPKGVVTITVGGKDRRLKFGTLQGAIFCELEGIRIVDMQNRLINQEPFTLINFVFSGAAAYSRLNREPVDYTSDDVSEWLDEVDQENLYKLITAAMGTYEEKKSEPKQAKKKTKR